MANEMQAWLHHRETSTMTNIQIHVKHQINEYQCKRHKHFQGHTKDIRTGLSFQSVLELGPELPLFGVCMGLQCIGEAYGVKKMVAQTNAYAWLFRVAIHVRKDSLMDIAEMSKTQFHWMMKELKSWRIGGFS
ncbi:uncharacterized protein LOC110007725 isoform X2 [Amborella trichopoda]|uniref:uncharacterized protein LOC110007725 isoform X2 n=1 Tax=Amborella trichopoda TaxID=13333 RepID=UPI0009BDACE4|nr:uncharacterized protein LOC110007725 isoform X2 [Amborella trichopoda]|eukprot:XP_020526148.1 uncharacterized protein LOC110007725 isoform X2 [Amborella trichopoda]